MRSIHRPCCAESRPRPGNTVSAPTPPWNGSWSATRKRNPRIPTIAEKFNTYRFADYKEQVIDLLLRVCTVSVETMNIVREMP